MTTTAEKLQAEPEKEEYCNGKTLRPTKKTSTLASTNIFPTKEPIQPFKHTMKEDFSNKPTWEAIATASNQFCSEIGQKEP